MEQLIAIRQKDLIIQYETDETTKIGSLPCLANVTLNAFLFRMLRNEMDVVRLFGVRDFSAQIAHRLKFEGMHRSNMSLQVFDSKILMAMLALHGCVFLFHMSIQQLLHWETLDAAQAGAFVL